MRLTDFDLRQMDDDWVDRLPADGLRSALQQALKDLKEARDRLNMTPDNSSRPPGSKAPWESTPGSPAQESDILETPEADAPDDGGSPDSGDQPKPIARKQKSKRPRGKQPGSPGHGRMQILSVTDTCAHRPTVCAGCGAPLPEDGPMQVWTAWDQVDIVPLPAGATGLQLCNTRHSLFAGTCRCSHVTRAVPFRSGDDCQWHNTDVAEWRLIGPSLAAMIVMLALRMRLSRARIQEFFDEFIGLSLSTGVIDQTIREAGRASQPIEETLVAEIQQAALLYIDETPWKESGRLLWMWTLVSATTILFSIGYRTREIIANILENKFIGILMSDGYVVYRQWENRLRCWAHLVRKARGLAESTDARVAKIGDQIMTLFDILMAAIYAARIDPAPECPRRQHAATIATLRQICERYRNDTHEKVRALAVELLLDWDVIVRQLDEPSLPLTNNRAEQALRHWVISRRISHGTRSADGSRALALLASIIETCRLRKASSWRYLAAVIDAARKGITPPSLPMGQLLAARV